MTYSLNPNARWTEARVEVENALNSLGTKLDTIEIGAEVNVTETILPWTNVVVSYEWKNARISSLGWSAGVSDGFNYNSFVATSWQTVFDIDFTYTAGNNELLVFVNWQKKQAVSDYTETDSNTITFVNWMLEGDVIEIVTWIKWDKWDTWDTWATGATWATGSTWPKWDKWDTWDTWPQWIQWIQGIQWEQGIQGIQWETWPAWSDWLDINWLWSYNGSTGYVVNDTISYNGSSYICKLASTGNLPTNATYFDLMAQKGTDWVDATWDVTWPASSTDQNIAVFDWVTGKIIEDWLIAKDTLALICNDQHAITNYTFDGTERRNSGYLCNTTSANTTININADLFVTWTEFLFCKGVDDAYTITLDAWAWNNINGSQTIILTYYNEFIQLIKDGANTWKAIQTLPKNSVVTPTNTVALTNKDLSSGNTFPTFNQNTTWEAGTVATIAGKISAWTNVTITGGGTTASPYVVNSSWWAWYTDEQAQDAVGSILVDSSEIDFTYDDTTPSITATIKSGSIDEAKLDTSVNASLDLADSSVQPASSPTLWTITTTGTIEIWHASDTTISRVSAWVVAIEWVNIVKAWAVTTNGVTMSTGKLLWRGTVSTWAIEEITLGNWLSFSWTTLNANVVASTGTVTATSWQTVVATPTHTVWNAKLLVYVNWQIQDITDDYTDTSTTSITFNTGLLTGDKVSFRLFS